MTDTCGHCGGWQLARKRPPAQPRSVFGSPEDIIEHGTDTLSAQTERLGVAMARAVHGLTNARAINAAIKRVGREWPRRRIALPLQGELMHGAMLGALDSDFEARTDRRIAVPSFAALHAPILLAPYDRSTDPAFATRPMPDARKQFEQREPVTRDVYDSMTDAARRRSVTVAGAATNEVVRTVQRELVRQVNEGADLREFSRRVVPRLEAAGWTPQNSSHAENVLRTNVGSAYNAGRARQMSQPTVLRFRSYWQIVTVNDGPPRQRATHQAAHLVVLRADDPFWLTAYPPFGYQCRCRVRSLSNREGEPLLGSPPRDLPDRGFTSGLSQLEVPPPSVPPANDTIAPPANDTVPPPRRDEQLGPEAFEAHLGSRAATVDMNERAHRTTRKVFGRDVTPAELDTFLGTDAFAGIEGERKIIILEGGGEVQFRTTIGRDVELVRSFRRKRGKVAVHHDLLFLPEHLQGEGIGPRVIKEQLKAYEALGVQQIDLDAAWIGRYYWPKLGFDVAPSRLPDYVGKFRRYLEGRGMAPDVVSRLTNGIRSMQDIALTRAGDEQLGKDFLLSGHAGAMISDLRMPVAPGNPVYDAMKAEVSKPPKRRKQRAGEPSLQLARRRRSSRLERGLTDPEGKGLADDLIGDDRAPRTGWRQFDAEGYPVDADGKRVD